MTAANNASVGRRGRGARDRIEKAAATLFYRNGIHATSVEHIVRQADVSKRTLYQYFSSKEELVADYLRALDARGGSPMEKRLGNPELSARDRLVALFDVYPADLFRGCPFHNAAVESAGAMPEGDAIVRRHKADFTGRLIAVAEEAGAADPYSLGHQLAVLFEGATALATTLNDTAPLVHARAAADVLIDAAIGTPIQRSQEA